MKITHFLFVVFFVIAYLLGACAPIESIQIGVGLSEFSCPDMGADYMPMGETDSACVYLDMMTGDNISIDK